MLYNTHGGNTSLIDVMARDLRAEFGLRTFALHGSGGISFEGLDPQERAYGFHAGEVETALSAGRACRNWWTAPPTPSNYIADISKPEMLLPENAPATFAWLTRDIAPSGVMGDPRPATAEKGARWLEQAATRLAAALRSDGSLSGSANANERRRLLVDCGNGVRLERGVRCRMSRRRRTGFRSLLSRRKPARTPLC